MNPTTRTAAPRTRRRRMMTAGVVAAGLSLAGAGAAMAGNDAPEATPDDFSAMPDGYTQAQYEAFWGAGYSYDDVLALNALWGSGDTETKARAGQLLIDGQAVPVAPTGPDEDPVAVPSEREAAPPAVSVDPAAVPAPAPAEAPAAAGDVVYTDAQYDAFWGAGYTVDDVVALNALWNSDFLETKARAGQLILDGQPVPVAPTGTPAAS